MREAIRTAGARLERLVRRPCQEGGEDLMLSFRIKRPGIIHEVVRAVEDISGAGVNEVSSVERVTGNRGA